MSRPLSFLHVTTFYPPHSFGGDGVFVHELARALAARGHAVDVAHCVDSYRLLARHPVAANGEADARITTHPLRSRFGPLAPLLAHQTGRPLLQRRALRRILAAKHYDVVHFHNISLFGPAVLALPAHPDAVRLYTAHEQWLICPTHVLWKLNRRPCETPQCLRCTLQARRPPQLWRHTGLLARASAHVDLFLAPSRFVADIHRARGFARPMTELPNFLPRPLAGATNTAQPHPRPYFLFAGRLETIKGVDSLIDTWQSFAAADLVIAGAGSRAAELRARAAANPRVRFVGALRRDQLAPFYAHAIATLIPSRTHETFPLVALESFSHGSPIVARRLGALPQIAAESDGGLLYDRDDELPALLLALVQSAERRDRLGENGRRAFVARWSEEVHLARYLALIDAAARQRLGHLPWAA